VELDALAIGHDLRRGRTSFAKVTRPVADRTLLTTGGPGAATGADGTATPDGTGDAVDTERAVDAEGAVDAERAVDALDDGSGGPAGSGEGAAA
jgi:hypothetical protein